MLGDGRRCTPMQDTIGRCCNLEQALLCPAMHVMWSIGARVSSRLVLHDIIESRRPRGCKSPGHIVLSSHSRSCPSALLRPPPTVAVQATLLGSLILAFRH